MKCDRFTCGARPPNGSLKEGFDQHYAGNTDLLEHGEDESLRDRQKDPQDWYQPAAALDAFLNC